MAPPASGSQSVSVDTSGTQTVELRVRADSGTVVDLIHSTVPTHIKQNRRDYRDLLGGAA